MQATAVIGPSIKITGTVSAQEPLTIAGHVNGSVEIAGHALSIAATAHVDGEVTADTIVIDGHVHGTLHAGTRIVVRETGNIEGDVTTPALSVAAGATLHGRIEADGRRTTALRLAS